MTRSPGPLLRALGRLLVRGPDAPFILGDMEEEMHRDIARGMGAARARLRFIANALASGASLARSRRSPRRAPRLGASWTDVKLGWRILWKNPLLTVVAGLALAIGIPVGLAPVHVMRAFDAPPPVEGADRLMGLRYQGDRQAATRAFEFDLWRRSLRSYEELAAVRQVERNLAPAEGVALPVAAAEVTASAFAVLRTRPLLGRGLRPSDETPGAELVVVLSHDVWQSRLEGRREAVGSMVRIMGVPHTVVGVMPEGFRFPVDERLWLPLRERPASEPGEGAALRVFGRLAPGASEETAQAELSALHGAVAAGSPDAFRHVRAEVVSLTTLMTGYPKGGLGAISGIGPLSAIGVFRLIALVMLVVACANVGLLIFARTATRSQELAVRTALGASRRRVVGQIVTEVLVLALLAAGLGLVLLHVLAERLLIAMLPAGRLGVPWWIDLGVDATTVARALGLAVFSAAVAALVPALRLTSEKIRNNLSTAGAGGFGIRFGGLWSALIVLDVAAAVAVVGFAVGMSARMERSVDEMTGLAAEEYLAVRIDLPDVRSPADLSGRHAELSSIHRRLVERLEADPGVRAVAVGDRLPRMDHRVQQMEIENGPGEVIEVVQVDPGFFTALGQPVLAGRGFDARDLRGSRSAVLVNAAFASELLGGQNPVGHRFRYLPWEEEPGPWLEIVGMVGDLGTDLLQPEDEAAAYHAAAPGEIYPIHLGVRTGGDPASLTPRIRELVADVDPALIVRLARPLSEVYPSDWNLFGGLLLGWSVFVAVLLAMAGAGVYAIMAFGVAQRTREIGIRAALGARALNVVTTIGGRAAFQLGAGTILGLPVAAMLYRMIDPTAPAGDFLRAILPGILLVMLVGLAACAGPLRRALRIAPNHAIREVG